MDPRGMYEAFYIVVLRKAQLRWSNSLRGVYHTTACRTPSFMAVRAKREEI